MWTPFIYHMPPPPSARFREPGRAVWQIERAVPGIGGKDDRALISPSSISCRRLPDRQAQSVPYAPRAA